MILFAFPEYQKLASYLLKASQLKPGKFKLNRFPNQELYVLLGSKVKDMDCLVLGTIAPPDENLLSTALLCHTLKKEGAKEITLLLPYIAYARADKYKAGESLAISLVSSLLKGAGVKKVITIDVHSHHVQELFQIPLKSVLPSQVFAAEIKKINFQEASLIAPDKSAYQRCVEIKNSAKMTGNLIYLEKNRTLKGISHFSLNGDVTEKILVIDDILDTGGTLVSCCQILKDKGVKKIIVMVTHGLFTGEKWKKLFNLGVKVIYCTNTVPLDKKLRSNKIKVLAVDQLIAEELGLNEKPRT